MVDDDTVDDGAVYKGEVDDEPLDEDTDGDQRNVVHDTHISAQDEHAIKMMGLTLIVLMGLIVLMVMISIIV